MFFRAVPKKGERFCFSNTRQEHEKTHSGERASQAEIHRLFDIPTKLVQSRLQAIKGGCNTCRLQLTIPKSNPASHIVSQHFGERILVDCKTLTGVGYLVVAVDHFTTHVWSTFVERKVAEPIADFVVSVFQDVDEIRATRKKPEGREDEGTTTTVHWSDDIGKVRMSANESVAWFF